MTATAKEHASASSSASGSVSGADTARNANAGPNANAGHNADAARNADPGELGKFDTLSHRFWDPLGEFRPLHVLNPVRARFVADRAKLAGARVLDVGCGGGLFCEALARGGGTVSGIDLAPGMIEVAKLHAIDQQLAIDYRVMDADAVANTPFDIVTSMEMLEHVPDPARMMATLSRLVRPGGNVFVSTVNRNLKSFLTAIVGAEYLLRLIPRGTHEYERLIQPAELAKWGRDSGLHLAELAGIDYNPISHTATLTRDPSVNYLAHFVRR